MKLEIENKHIKDDLVRLDDDYATNHIYLIRGKSHKDLGFDSVTTYLKKLSPKFNPDEILIKWELNNDPRLDGKTKEEIKKEWQVKGKEAAELGTYMHEQFELYFNDVEHDNTIDEFKQFLEVIEIKQLKAYRTEMTVFSDKYRLVGNVDLIVDNGDGTFDIWDYKRTFDISDNSFNKLFNYPLMDLPCSDKNKYALQLSIYKYMLETEYGIKIRDLYNLAIKESKCTIVKQDYLFEEVLRLLNARL